MQVHSESASPGLLRAMAESEKWRDDHHVDGTKSLVDKAIEVEEGFPKKNKHDWAKDP